MKFLYLQSEDALYFYLKKFLKQSPKAVQLDGATKTTKSNKVMVVFSFSITGQKYKLTGSLTRKAAETFVGLVEEHGSASLALKEYEPKEGSTSPATLILSNSKSPGGWDCLPFVDKASQKLKRAA